MLNKKKLFMLKSVPSGHFRFLQLFYFRWGKLDQRLLPCILIRESSKGIESLSPPASSSLPQAPSSSHLEKMIFLLTSCPQSVSILDSSQRQRPSRGFFQSPIYKLSFSSFGKEGRLLRQRPS